MLITCPSCGHAKDVDSAKIPPNAVEVKCPKCGELFPYASAVAASGHAPLRPADAKLSPPRVSHSAPASSGVKTAPVQGAAFGLKFFGTGGELFKIYLSNFFLNLITLGFYRAWAKVKLRKYLYSSTELLGERFSYTGTGKELFNGMAKGGAVFFLPLILINAAAEFVGDYFALLAYPFLAFTLPVLFVSARRYRASRTTWRGIRFAFSGNWKEALAIYIPGYLLTILTAGIYAPWLYVKKQEFWRSKTGFGNTYFKYVGDGRELLKTFIVGVILSMLTLGVYSLWLRAALVRYDWEHTSFDGLKFKSNVTGGSLLGLWLVNILMLVFTFGIAYPWVQMRVIEYNYSMLEFSGSVDFDRIAQASKAASAIGDSVAEEFDADIAM